MRMFNLSKKCTKTLTHDSHQIQKMSPDQASCLAELFKALADPARLQILSVLSSGELCVSDICAELKMSQSSVSHQLRLLRSTNLVKVRRSGQHAFYSLSCGHSKTLFDHGLDHIIDAHSHTAHQTEEEDPVNLSFDKKW